MNCYICEPNAVDIDSTCEYHRYELQALCEYMADKTGCYHFISSNTPFISIDISHIPHIEGFIAGSELLYDVVKINSNYQLIDRPQV